MTCIVAIRNSKLAIMGYDSQSSGPGISNSAKNPKVTRLSGMLIGNSGCWRTRNLVTHFLKVPYVPKTNVRRYLIKVFVPALAMVFKDQGALMNEDGVIGLPEGSNLVIATPHFLGYVQQDLSVVESAEDYIATGAGEDLAMGALHATRTLAPRESARRALAAAIAHSPKCGGTVKTLEIL